MPGQLEQDVGITASFAGADRRRPGRVEYANPNLVKLLRRVPAASAVADADAAWRSRRPVDGLAAARGIGASAVLGAMAWVGVLMGLWLLLHP